MIGKAITFTRYVEPQTGAETLVPNSISGLVVDKVHGELLPMLAHFQIRDIYVVELFESDKTVFVHPTWLK